MLYDQLDSAPSLLSDMSTLAGFSSGSAWSGSAGANMLADFSSKKPESCICTDLDIAEPGKWYRTLTQSETNDYQNTAIGNLYIPSKLVVHTVGGSSDVEIDVGNLYVVYEIELRDPVTKVSQLPTIDTIKQDSVKASEEPSKLA